MWHVPFYSSASAHNAASWLTEQQWAAGCTYLQWEYVRVCVREPFLTPSHQRWELFWVKHGVADISVMFIKRRVYQGSWAAAHRAPIFCFFRRVSSILPPAPLSWTLDSRSRIPLSPPPSSHSLILSLRMGLGGRGRYDGTPRSLHAPLSQGRERTGRERHREWKRKIIKWFIFYYKEHVHIMKS